MIDHSSSLPVSESRINHANALAAAASKEVVAIKTTLEVMSEVQWRDTMLFLLCRIQLEYMDGVKLGV